MWSALLESFLFLFTLIFITVGKAYPTNDLDTESTKGNNIMTSTNAAASVTLYECVYIPPNLDICLISHKENLWNSLNFPENFRKLSENKKLKIMESKVNKIFFTLHPSMRVPETQKVQKKPFVETIIYELQTCIPPRLPFILPWCTEEDFSDNSTIYPIKYEEINLSINKTPHYNFSKYKFVKKS